MVDIDHQTAFILSNRNFAIAFGFLAGQEVKNEKVGNLGLRDRKYISYQSLFIFINHSPTY